MNNNQPPAPTAGHVNDQQMPEPPKPAVPGTNQPAPQPPQPMVRKANAVVSKEPQATVYQVLMSAGWIPVDKGSLSATSDQIIGDTTDHPVSFMSENGKYMITCRSSAIYAVKTKFE